MARILIVDDEPNNRLLLSTLLRHAGHAVLEAATANEALQIALRTRPDVAVVDLSLPDMPGAQLLRSLRSENTLAGMTIALYTASQTEPVVAELTQTFGIRGVIPKPADPQEILGAFERLLSGDVTPNRGA